MARISMRLSDDLNEAIEDHIGYGSKSEYFRQLAREDLAREESSDESADDADAVEA